MKLNRTYSKEEKLIKADYTHLNLLLIVQIMQMITCFILSKDQGIARMEDNMLMIENGNVSDALP